MQVIRCDKSIHQMSAGYFLVNSITFSPNWKEKKSSLNFLYGKFFRAMQLYYDEATTDVLSFLRHDLDLHVSNFESKLSGKFQLHLFLSAIKSELNKKQAQFGKSIYDLNAQSDFPALCHEAGRQRSHVFPDAEGKTNTLIVLLNITRDTLLAPNYALLSDPFLQQYRFPARYTISLITHFDLLELGLFRQSGLCGKTPLQIYVRNQNLKRLYLASSTTLYFGFHDSLTQLYCVHPDFPFTLSAAKPIGDPAKYFFDKLLKAASPRFEFFANAETKKINSVVISVSGQSNPTVDNLVAKLREFKCDLKQATAAVKVMLQEAYLINQKCEWTSFVNGVTRHASVCRN